MLVMILLERRVVPMSSSAYIPTMLLHAAGTTTIASLGTAFLHSRMRFISLRSILGLVHALALRSHVVVFFTKMPSFVLALSGSSSSSNFVLANADTDCS